MNSDLKIIKKYFGEQMAYLCRELFSTILDNSPGELANIICDSFEPNRFLYDDLMMYEEAGKINDFKNYIYARYGHKHDSIEEDDEENLLDPVKLMRQVGYTLYECKSEKDIQKFRKYYMNKELLCTFTLGNRLRNNYVYFAVRDGASKLKRSDFTNPRRQDEYGTSVISIQFTRDASHTLSIKNRYNHTVENPDATFSNNLDNIVPGLTKSFEKYYGLQQLHYDKYNFELPGYVRANDGKYYKYNYEIDNVYYCLGNVVIDKFEAIKYPKEKYLVVDYFIIDLVNKEIKTKTYDSFPMTVGTIKNITVKNDTDKKIITITPNNGEDIELVVDDHFRLVSVKNNNVVDISDNFLTHTKNLRKLVLNNVKTIGNEFLFSNISELDIILPNVRKIGSRFVIQGNVRKIELPKVVKIGNQFLLYNKNLKNIELPEVEVIGKDFLVYNSDLEKIYLPKVMEIGDSFLENNQKLISVYLPNVLKIGDYFCYSGEGIWELSLPKLIMIGKDAMRYNHSLFKLVIPDTAKIGTGFLEFNSSIKKKIYTKR